MIFSRRLLTDLQEEHGQQMQLWRKCNKTLLQDIKSPLQLCKRITSLKLLNACVMKWPLCGLLLPSPLGACVRAAVTCAPHLYLCSRSPMCCFSSFSCTSRWCNFFCSSADCRKETTVQSHIRRHTWDVRHETWTNGQSGTCQENMLQMAHHPAGKRLLEDTWLLQTKITISKD